MKEIESIDSRIIKELFSVERFFTDIDENSYVLSFDISELSEEPFAIKPARSELDRPYVEFSADVLRTIENTFSAFLQKYKDIGTIHCAEKINASDDEWLETQEYGVYTTIFIKGKKDIVEHDRLNGCRLTLSYGDVKYLHDFILLILEKYDLMEKEKENA